MIGTSFSDHTHHQQTLTNAILSPLSHEFDWHDIEVVTLRQAAIDKATDYVLDRIVTITDVDAQIANELSTAEYQISREHVSVSADKITIAIKCDKVTDHVMNKAMEMLMAIKQYTPGIHYFGPEHVIDFRCTNDEFAVS